MILEDLKAHLDERKTDLVRQAFKALSGNDVTLEYTLATIKGRVHEIEEIEQWISQWEQRDSKGS